VSRQKQNSGYTLIEVLISISIFAMIAVAFASLFISFLRISESDKTQSEVTSQLNFIMQRITGIIQGASAYYVRCDSSPSNPSTNDRDTQGDESDQDCDSSQPGIQGERLVVRVRNETTNAIDDSNGPIEIYRDSIDQSLKITIGRGTMKKPYTLSNSQITLDSLSFSKSTSEKSPNPLSVTLTVSSKKTFPSKITRMITSGILRSNAAVFDTEVIPSEGSNGITGTDLGQNSMRWRKGYFADGDFSGTVTAGAVTTNSLTLGSGGASIGKVYRGSFSVELTVPIAAGNEIVGDTVITISGARDLVNTDIVIVTPQTNPSYLVTEGWRVTSGSQISGRVRNSSVNGVVRPGIYTFNYLIIK